MTTLTPDLVVFKKEDYEGEEGSIMWSRSPLPHLSSSARTQQFAIVLCERGTKEPAGTGKQSPVAWDRQKLFQKLIAAPRATLQPGEPLCAAIGIYYHPHAFEGLEKAA